MNHNQKRLVRAGALILAVPAIFAAGVLTGAVQTRTGMDELMRSKLLHAQTLVEGLALENYDKIKSSAEELSLISQTAQWSRIQSPRFSQMSAEFRSRVDRIAMMAGDKNLDGATLSSTQAIVSCVDCHKLVRSNEKISLK